MTEPSHTNSQYSKFPFWTLQITSRTSHRLSGGGQKVLRRLKWRNWLSKSYLVLKSGSLFIHARYSVTLTMLRKILVLLRSRNSRSSECCNQSEKDQEVKRRTVCGEEGDMDGNKKPSSSGNFVTHPPTQTELVRMWKYFGFKPKGDDLSFLNVFYSAKLISAINILCTKV